MQQAAFRITLLLVLDLLQQLDDGSGSRISCGDGSLGSIQLESVYVNSKEIMNVSPLIDTRLSKHRTSYQLSTLRHNPGQLPQRIFRSLSNHSLPPHIAFAIKLEARTKFNDVTKYFMAKHVSCCNIALFMKFISINSSRVFDGRSKNGSSKYLKF